MKPATAFDVDIGALVESLHRLAVGIDNGEINVVRVTTAETTEASDHPEAIQTFMIRYYGPPEAAEKIQYKP